MDFHSTIEPYLNNTLSDQERLAFEALLSADPALARDFALYKEARESLVRKFGDQVDTSEVTRLIKEREQAYLANRLRMRIAMWVIAVGVVVAGILFSWQPWKAAGPMQGTADSPCFDYDFTEGPLDEDVWEIVEPSRDINYSMQNDFLRLETGAGGGSVALRLKGYLFEGDLEGIIEIGDVEMGDRYGRDARVEFAIPGDDGWQVPQFMFLGARNRLAYYGSPGDLVIDKVGIPFDPKHFYKFQRIADTFVLSHANTRTGPYAEMQRHIVPGYYQKFNSFDISISSTHGPESIYMEVDRVTIFKGCLKD